MDPINQDELYEHYLFICKKAKIGEPNLNERPLLPYNLLITEDWIALIRRNSEYSNGFNINALGFAGYFLATSRSQTKWLINNGANALLSKVVSPLY